MRRRCLLLLALCACGSSPTQTIVRLRAAEGLTVPAGAMVRLQLWPDGVPQHEAPTEIGTFSFAGEIAVPVEPRGGDAARRFTLFAELIGPAPTEERLSWARVRTGFAREARSEVRIELAAGCPTAVDRPRDGDRVDPASACGSHDTCIAAGALGACSPSCYDPEPFEPSLFAGPSAARECSGADCLAVDSLESGWTAMCATGQGRLACWGQLTPAQPIWPRPTWILDDSGRAMHDTARPWTSAAFGARHLCAVRGGVLHCGGQDLGGQLANGAAGDADCCTAVAMTSPSPPPAMRTVVADGNYVCTLDVDGGVWCAGDHPFGDPPVDVLTALAPSSVTAIGAGRLFACVVDAGGLRCVGLAPPLRTTIAWSGGALVSKEEALCITDPAGVASCWGPLADGTTPAAMPYALPGAWSALSVGSYSGASAAVVRCGVSSDGALLCWGVNDATGRLGVALDALAHAPEAEPFRLGARTDWAAVAVGEAHACAATASGEVWCWGANAARQLGTGAAGGPELVPVCVPSF